MDRFVVVVFRRRFNRYFECFYFSDAKVWHLGKVWDAYRFAHRYERPPSSKELLNIHRLGFAIWLAAFVFFRKAAADFNVALTLEGGDAPALSAQPGTAFFRKSIHQKNKTF
jgi:hypothetical protein